MLMLDLILKSMWYWMIHRGEKLEEYREIKAYWIVRMMEEVDMGFHSYKKVSRETAEFYENNPHLLKNALYHGSMRFKDFDGVVFRLGYFKDRPSMIKPIKDIIVGQGCPEWGAVKGKEYIVIRLRNEE